MIVLRHLSRFTLDLALYALRTGRWWMPLVTVLLVVVAVVVAATKVVVPTAVYTLF